MRSNGVKNKTTFRKRTSTDVWGGVRSIVIKKCLYLDDGTDVAKPPTNMLSCSAVLLWVMKRWQGAQSQNISHKVVYSRWSTRTQLDLLGHWYLARNIECEFAAFLSSAGGKRRFRRNRFQKLKNTA